MKLITDDLECNLEKLISHDTFILFNVLGKFNISNENISIYQNFITVNNLEIPFESIKVNESCNVIWDIRTKYL